MKKVTKVLALVLALVLVIGVVPVQAAEKVSLKKSSKVLYLGGCIGKKANGKKAKYYSFLKVKNNIKGFDSKTMDVKLEADDDSIVTVSNKTAKITAKKRGTTEVTVTVRNKKNEQTIRSMTLEIIVKKNSDKNFEVSGITDGKEYKVNDKITVKMPRTNDDDYRKLTCSSSDVKIDKTGSYGSEYTVTFKKAGTYTIKAETYQTSTYKGTIQSKSFKVTVKGEDKPEPTVTPTPVTSKLTAKQTALDTVEITGFANPAEIKASDIEIYYEILDIKMEQPLIKEVKADGDKLVVTMYSDFEGNTEYKVAKKGDKDIEPGSFKGISATEKDIASMSVSPNKVLVNVETEIEVKYFNKDKIDITSRVKDKVFPEVKMLSVTDDAYGFGNIVCLQKANIAAKFEVSVFTGVNDIGTAQYAKSEFTVVSYEPQYQSYLYTIKEDNGTYLKETDTLSTSFAYNATNPVIEVLFKYTDPTTGKSKYNTLAEEGITKIEPADKTVLFMGGQSPTGGYYLSPNKPGTTSLLIYRGDKVVATAKVDVLGEAKASSVVATLSKSTLNVNAMLSDKLEIKVTVKDQYGKELKGQPITIEQTEQTKTSTGIANFGSFVDGVLVVNGADIVLNAGKTTQGTIQAVIKSGSGQYTIQFSVANVEIATKAVLTSDPEQAVTLKTGIKAGDVKPETFSFSIQSKNGNYMVKNENMRLYPKQVVNPIKCTDLGVADGETVYLYTIRYTDKNNQTKYLTTLPGLATDGTTEVIFKAYDYQSKLDEGTYLIQAYRVVAGTNNSNIDSSVGQKTFVVINDQPKVEYKQTSVTTTYSNAVDVVKDCFEFTIDGKKLETLDVVDADMHTDGDGTKFVKSVTIRITNTIYGPYDFKISTLNSKTIK